MELQLIENTGNDLMPVNAARVSFDKHHDTFITKEEAERRGEKGSDEGLISYLTKNVHWTPFAHSRETYESIYSIVDPELLDVDLQASMVSDNDYKKVRHSLFGWVQLINADVITNYRVKVQIIRDLVQKYPYTMKAYGFDKQWLDVKKAPSIIWDVPTEEESDSAFIDVTMRETVPIFVARQRFKHAVGFVYNEVSRRYVDDTPDFFVPTVWRGRPTDGAKQGSSDENLNNLYVKPWDDADARSIHDWYRDWLEDAQFAYEALLSWGVAPEQARMILPQAMMTSYYVTGSLDAWARAYINRIDPHAQYEIRELFAKEWDRLISEKHGEVWNGAVEKAKEILAKKK